MKNFVERFKWQDIERSAGDDTTLFMLKTWLINKGTPTENLLPLTTKLIILGQPRISGTLPNILMCGNNSLAAKLFGANWADCPHLHHEIIKPAYQALIAGSYHDAEASNEPVFDLVSAEINGLSLRYQRLILPFSTITGIKFQYLYSMPIGSLLATVRIPSDV